MRERELDAAGIADTELRASYQRCRTLNARYGRTYYLATLLLPPDKRPFVHALYGFARYADEIVDDLGSDLTQEERATLLKEWGQRFLIDHKRGSSDDPICRAVVHTAHRWNIDTRHFEAFLSSMTMDLTISEYADYDALYEYVYGSAAVIGLQMLPILGALTGQVGSYAIDLGVAFQLANFVRDVGEDLDRGRLYLPLADLKQFGVTRKHLERRVVDDKIRELLRFQITRVRRLAQAARPGIAMLPSDSRACIDAARRLYIGIVDEVERIDYQVFDTRARVGMARRAGVALSAFAHVILTRASGR